jgi:hypothetical protein
LSSRSVQADSRRGSFPRRRPDRARLAQQGRTGSTAPVRARHRSYTVPPQRWAGRHRGRSARRRCSRLSRPRRARFPCRGRTRRMSPQAWPVTRHGGKLSRLQGVVSAHRSAALPFGSLHRAGRGQYSVPHLRTEHRIERPLASRPDALRNRSAPIQRIGATHRGALGRGEARPAQRPKRCIPGGWRSSMGALLPVPRL